MKKIFILLTILVSTFFISNISMAQEFGGGGDDDDWFENADWWTNLPGESGTFIWGGGAWYGIGDGFLLEDVVVEATPIDDWGELDAWDYEWESDDWSHYDQNGDYWYEDNPYDYHVIDPPYGDEEVDMSIVNQLATAINVNYWYNRIGRRNICFGR